MDITVADIRESVNSRLRKSQNNRAVDPKRFNDLLLLAFIRELRNLTGLGEAWVPGQNQPVMGLENSMRNVELLKPLLVVAIYPDSFVKTPNGVMDTSEMMIISNLATVNINQSGPKVYPVDFLKPGEVMDRINHPIKGAKEMFPIAFYKGETEVQILPQSERANVIYYRVPKIPFYDWTISNDVESYLPEGQTHDGSVLTNGTPSRTQQIELDFRALESIENRIYEFAAARSNDQIALELAQIRKRLKQ